MKIKLDENLPHRLVQTLTDLGDVDTVLDERIAGRDDGVVWTAAQASTTPNGAASSHRR